MVLSTGVTLVNETAKEGSLVNGLFKVTITFALLLAIFAVIYFVFWLAGTDLTALVGDIVNKAKDALIPDVVEDYTELQKQSIKDVGFLSPVTLPFYFFLNRDKFFKF